MGWLGEKLGLDDPMRQGDPRYQSMDQGNYQLPGFEQRNQGLDQFAANRGGGAFRQGQLDLASYLGQQMRGQNSVSRAQLGQDLNRLQGQQMSMAASARPSNAAMAQRLAMQGAGNAGAQIAGQAQLAALAERNAAANALGGVYGTGRGQDLQAYLGAQQLALGNAQAQQQGTMGYENARNQRYLASLGVPTNREGLMSALGSGMSLAGGMGG